MVASIIEPSHFILIPAIFFAAANGNRMPAAWTEEGVCRDRGQWSREALPTVMSTDLFKPVRFGHTDCKEPGSSLMTVRLNYYLA